MKMQKEFIETNKKFLDEKKEQTSYKIKYVSKYVENWLYVVTNTPEVKNINFVDCMCNAGVYTDGEIGTSMKVLELFNRFAQEHQDKVFRLILNDYNSDRIAVIEKVVNQIGIKASNIHVITQKRDINEFLLDDSFFKKYFNCFPYKSSNVVFVDPYNFCTVKISSLEHFISKKYCELIYNIFTNDYVRNQDKDKMISYCKEEKIPLNMSKDDMVNTITERLKKGNIKFSFSYEFKISTNTELYQIMFFTPNIRGLEKLKEALWYTFDGKEFYRNGTNDISDQIPLFTHEDEINWRLDNYAVIAEQMVEQKFNGKIVDFNILEEFIIENTMLNSNHIIKKVLKPLVDNGKIRKMGLVERSSNYKRDKYQIGVKNENH